MPKPQPLYMPSTPHSLIDHSTHKHTQRTHTAEGFFFSASVLLSQPPPQTGNLSFQSLRLLFWASHSLFLFILLLFAFVHCFCLLMFSILLNSVFHPILLSPSTAPPCSFLNYFLYSHHFFKMNSHNKVSITLKFSSTVDIKFPLSSFPCCKKAQDYVIVACMEPLGKGY